MGLYNEFIELFNAVQQESIITEDFKEVNITFCLNQTCVPIEYKLISFLNSYSYDFLSIEIIHITNQGSYNDPIIINNSTNNTNDFISNINDQNKYWEDGDQYEIKLRIFKKADKNIINVYFLDSFFSYLQSLSLFHILKNFNELFQQLNYKEISFHTIEESICLKTPYIHIGNINDQNSFHGIIHNETKVEYGSDCNFLQRGQFENLSLNTFRLLVPCSINEYNDLFYRLNYIYFLIDICNLSQIENDYLIAQLEGYKLIKNRISFNNFSVLDIDEINSIYDWIYCEESYSDKLGLSRNIISLSLDDNNLSKINSGIYSSIESNFKIYLKENVSRYIEIKNNISEHLFQLSEKSHDYCESFSNSFKTSITSIITFFITVIVLNVVAGNRFNEIFTDEICIVSSLFIVISLLYLLFLHIDKKKYLVRFKSNYDRIKSQYADLLCEKDIIKIFKSDQVLKEDIKYIDSKIHLYTLCWLIILLLLAIMIILFYNNII
ncbi:MAG: hypothetical protein CVV56_07935 [Tenericutes bacterium HGW-Tenericutes-1]|jgi:hypothetical protein|nr:MAG: hypothetical protein CVV56_07935 [Tenericutes bacterium HGW-Tenericutes-1]PKM95776.1 MAG: hypothetical protein CVU84_02965 [Firmicutes bacterium HGW-Firmicutes-1]